MSSSPFIHSFIPLGVCINVCNEGAMDVMYVCMLLDLRSRILDQISSQETEDGDEDKMKGIFRYSTR